MEGRCEGTYEPCGSGAEAPETTEGPAEDAVSAQGTE